MDVATYCRISTDEERQPFSLHAQTERLATYIAAQPEWRHVRSYTDQISGKSLDRPGLQQALGDARRGCYELLLVFKVDRLARSTGGLARVLEELDSTGVAFRSASEPFDTSTAAGRMMVQMLGVFAEFEREMIVERTKMGLAKKAAGGEWTGGIAPYGYHYDTDARVLVPDQQEAANVRRVFELYLEHQLGTASISNWMNDRSFLTRRGARWTPKKVIDVLRNPTYLGRLPFNGEVFEAAHDPLIDEERFNEAQQLIATRAESNPDRRRNSTGYLLSSLMKCAKCGHGFIGTGAHGRGGTYRYYTCFARQRHGTARCDQDRIPADSVEDAILSVTFDALSDQSFFQEVAELARREWEQAHPGRERDLRRLAQAIEQKRASIDRYLTAFESGKLPEEACGHRVSALQREIVALETERSRLEAEYDLAPSLPTDDLLEELRAALLRASEEKAVEKLKQVLACVVDTIVVEGRDHIQPYFFVPGVLTVFPSRRRTGIEPARELDAPSSVLKTEGPTRNPDASACELILRLAPLCTGPSADPSMLVSIRTRERGSTWDGRSQGSLRWRLWSGPLWPSHRWRRQVVAT